MSRELDEKRDKSDLKASKLRGNKWFTGFVIETGWEKHLPRAERINRVKRAFKEDYLAAARHLQELANVSQDKKEAKKDADYFLYLYHTKMKSPIAKAYEYAAKGVEDV
jgi:hypothetical protein